MRFVVPGEPKPKERPRFNTRTGQAYTPKATRVYEEGVGWVAKAKGERFGTDEVVVSTWFYFSKTRKPDGDNCHKSILDGLQAAGIFENDSQVVEGHYYVDKDVQYPRAEVEIVRFFTTPCIYCGNPAKSDKTAGQPTCPDHEDLVALDTLRD